MTPNSLDSLHKIGQLGLNTCPLRTVYTLIVTLPLHLTNTILHHSLYMDRLLDFPCTCLGRSLHTCRPHPSHSRHCTCMTTALPGGCLSSSDRTNSLHYHFLPCMCQRHTQCSHQVIPSILERTHLCSRPTHHYLQPLSYSRDSPDKNLRYLLLVGWSTCWQRTAGIHRLTLQSRCISLPCTRGKRTQTPDQPASNILPLYNCCIPRHRPAL